MRTYSMMQYLSLKVYIQSADKKIPLLLRYPEAHVTAQELTIRSYLIQYNPYFHNLFKIRFYITIWSMFKYPKWYFF
jgi:hypothetical protein